MHRCKKCILPETYPDITFDAEGVCNYCSSYRQPSYRGKQALQEKIETFLQTKQDRNAKYDCVVAYSGGRDSSYLLHYFATELNLRVIAYFVDNGFVPEQTRQNINSMLDLLDVELVEEEYHQLEKCVKHHISSWLHKPSAAMVGMLCTGCRLAMNLGIAKFLKTNNIPVVVVGSTPLDSASFKQRILSADSKTRSHVSFARGYLSEVLKNPRWIANPYCSYIHVMEFYHRYYRASMRFDGALTVRPFKSFIRWEEQELISRIENGLNWRKHPSTESSWRGDCDIALLKLYLYKKLLGFNDKDEGLSYLVRDGQISRDEALHRLEGEGEIPEEIVREIFDRLELNFSDLKTALGA
jgi:hypothetical protein